MNDSELYQYYSECLICTVDSTFPSENVTLDEENPCLKIELRCVQIRFSNRGVFEDFFTHHQSLIYDLFYKVNRTDQNTLHIIFTENTLNELNQSYIEEYFPIKYQGYRALILEFLGENQTLKLNRDLTNLTRLSIRVVLSCTRQVNREEQSIYLIYDHRIIIEQERASCSALLIPILSTIPTITEPPSSSSSLITETPSSSSTQTVSTVVLSSSKEKSSNTLIIALLTIALLSALSTAVGLAYYKYWRKSRSIFAEGTSETNSETSSHDQISVDSVKPMENPPIKTKKAKKPMNSRLLWLDEM